MADTQTRSIEGQGQAVERAYPLPPRVFYATRRLFFLGRRQIIRALPFPIEQPAKILEVGCGAGHNLYQLARWFPNALLVGTDVSPHLLGKAERTTEKFWERVELIQEPYLGGGKRFKGQVDAILFSYSLAGPQWKELILQAEKDLCPGGIIAVVDFHRFRFPWLYPYVSKNNAGRDGLLLPFLNKEFESLASEVRPACWGLWEYFLFLGRKRAEG